MGHLVNATSMRLGWFSNWSDSWFAEHIYYSEYLYTMFRIRFFLIHVLHSHDIEELGFFYSHFEFLYKANCLYIDIYLYDGPLESDIEFFFFDTSLIFRRLKQEYYGKTNLNIMWFRVWKLFLVITLFNYFTTTLWIKSRIKNFIRAIYNLKINDIFEFYNDKRFIKDSGGRQKATMMVFYVLLNELKNFIGPTFIQVNVSKHIYMTRFLFSGFLASWRHVVLTGLKYYINYIMNVFIPFYKNTINVYYITSYAVTAKFLSRYIARKLQQNYRIGELLYPIKRELNFVSNLVSYPLSKYFYKSKTLNWRIHNIWFFRSSIFKYILSFLINLYNKFFADFYNTSKSWYSFDIILLYNSALKNMNLLKGFFGLNRKNYSNKYYFVTQFYYYDFLFSINFKKLLNISKLNNLYALKNNMFNKIYFINILNILNFFKFCYYYYYNRPVYVYLYNNNNKEINNYLNNYFQPYTLLNFKLSYNIYNYVEFIFNDLYVNLNYLIFFKNNLNLNFKYLLHSNKYLNRFLKYNFWTTNLNWLYSYLNINKRKLRLNYNSTTKYLIGFKFHCLGRFTRRQRASSQWVGSSKIPLNTLSAIIDYSFFIIPLRNSSVAVKVWLYKTKDYNEYYLKVA